MTALGSIVKSDRLHGHPFGYAASVRNEGTPFTSEFRVDTLHGHTWLPTEQVKTATLNDVLAYFDERERAYEERIKKLRNMIGTKVPKFNPGKHLGNDADALTDAYRHEDGSLTYVFIDPAAGDADNPRTFDGNIATLIQINTRCIDIDEDDEGLAEACERWIWAGHRDPKGYMKRYLAMFRPDIAYFTEHWSAGDSYGWGYVTKAKWENAMGADYDGDITPEVAFDQEVRTYSLWASGEIYASAHVAERGAEPDVVHGHLGYANSRDIAAYHTDSPILEVLA